MTPRHRRRWQRYAACSALQVLLLLPVFAGVPTAVQVALIVVAYVIAFWAWGHVQAEIAFNPDFGDAERARWRITLACVPGAIAAYWLLYVR